ncbi:MAG: hypothetical protein JWO36_5326 [Myxococcales bacterium]|nr:hypothetical protein [Myxococcales bacterium]
MKPPKHIEYVFDEGSGLYVRVKTPDETQRSVVFASESHAALLRAVLPKPYVFVTSRAELTAAAAKRGAVIFIDVDLLYQIDGELTNIPIVAIIDDAPSETLQSTIRSLDTFPWLSHLVSTSMLSTPAARSHLTTFLERLAYGPEHGMLNASGVGRVALLARASRREARFERMNEFFSKQGLSARTITAISEVSEELVMNALYDAPVEAGYFKKPVPRTVDVDLPPERACEISYGIDGSNVFVRIRDTFGALTRSRLLDVLNRCNGTTVPLDESRGGAGLGLWRVFSTASTIAITVVPGQLTDILVGISTHKGKISKQLQAVHFFFVAKTNGSMDSLVPSEDHDLMDQSITLVLVA